MNEINLTVSAADMAVDPLEVLSLKWYTEYQQRLAKVAPSLARRLLAAEARVLALETALRQILVGAIPKGTWLEWHQIEKIAREALGEVSP